MGPLDGRRRHLPSGCEYSDMWAAVAVAAPWVVVSIDQLERFKQTPILVLQGDADQNVPVDGTRD